MNIKLVESNTTSGVAFQRSLQYEVVKAIERPGFRVVIPDTQPPNSLSLATHLDILMDAGRHWSRSSDGSVNIDGNHSLVARLYFDCPELGASQSGWVMQVWGNYEIQTHVATIINTLCARFGVVLTVILEGDCPLQSKPS